ncbi:MAG: peptidylprolyl isomerase [Anaerolineae bacterium]|nr:peptidylprolyl isomerase [Anaerolineae bacterium]
MLRRTILAAVVIVAVIAGALPLANVAPVSAQSGPTPDELCAAAVENAPEPESREFEQADDVLKDGVDYGVVFCTERGAIYIDLLEAESPMTVNNFVFLAQQDFFNNTTFHRVLPGFMAQGGDPTGTGGGGPGYEFGDETDNGLAFDQAGLLAMANAGPGTNGSQFFITYAETPWLDGNHTIFGRVLQGMIVAEALTPRDPDTGPAYTGDILHAVVIVEDPASMTITPDPAPDVDTIQAAMVDSLLPQLTGRLVVQEDYTHTYDLDAEAESWEPDGGAALVDYLRAYLSDHNFLGTAAALLTIDECPENPADFPFSVIAFQVSDYGTADGGAAVVFDDARSDQLVETGAYEGYADVFDGAGRLYTRVMPEDARCGANNIYYRLELPVGRYVLASDLIADSTVINDSSDPTAEEFAAYLGQNLLQYTLGGVLARGNAAVE